MNASRTLTAYAPHLLLGVALVTLSACPTKKAALVGENGHILVATGFWEFEVVEDLTGDTERVIFTLNPDRSVEHNGEPYPAAWNQIGDAFLLAENIEIPNGYIYEADVRDSFLLRGDYYVRINGNEFKVGGFTANYLPTQTDIDLPVEQAPPGVL